jgi:hypothetical protein
MMQSLWVGDVQTNYPSEQKTSKNGFRKTQHALSILLINLENAHSSTQKIRMEIRMLVLSTAMGIFMTLGMVFKMKRLNIGTKTDNGYSKSEYKQAFNMINTYDR